MSNQWISVEDRLPEIGEYGESKPVLIYSGMMDVATLIAPDQDDEGPYWREDHYMRVDYVSHWMPLPEPPEEK